MVIIIESEWNLGTENRLNVQFGWLLKISVGQTGEYDNRTLSVEYKG